ncbi:MAG: PaaI family thioesterase [Desulfobacterales bacterium]|nr:PaaI family thioesterase [Desulfobacterales bacterium]
MPNFNAVDPDFESRIRTSFGRQMVMQTIGARLDRIRPGEVRIELPFSAALTQQHGYLHAGIVGIIVDSACGYAAYTLMPADSEVPGRTLTVCAGEVHAYAGGEPKLIAAMQATMIGVAK